MPLIEADGSIDPHTLTRVPERFLIFYSSIVDGRLWCPDCRAIEGLVKDTFAENGPGALLVYVGDRGQWKASTNIYRQDPWNLTEVPTIIRLKNVKEAGRLTGDSAITKDLAEFVKDSG